MTFKLSSKSIKNRKGINPKLIEISDLAIQLTLVDFGHGTYAGKRTVKTQNQLFVSGKSQRDGVTKLSYHQSGNALDFYAYVNGHASWERGHLVIVACAFFQAASILGYGIKWGGMWKSRRPKIIDGVEYGWDMPHIQLLD